MGISRRRKAGQNRTIKIIKKSFENVEKFDIWFHTKKSKLRV